MKKVYFAFSMISLFALSLSAQAKEIQLYSYDIGNNAYEASSSINYSQDFGRAWAEFTINLDPDSSTDEPRIENERVQVPGLSLDRSNNQVVLADGRQQVVCGSIEKTFFGLSDTFEANGNCTIEQKVELRHVDDGFDGVYDERYLVFTLNVPALN